ncbi:gamma-glutamyl-gamma-aminobutyrate hydrolase family protein [Candidatus Micrarchaeota archaeon]|nr:gamma-glutamyl-gamma-aminobutyrate hydrolase family protein [Candidatus Micrarchaeota archaeon]
MATLALIDNYPSEKAFALERKARFVKAFPDLEIFRRDSFLKAEFAKKLDAEFDGIVLTGSPDNVTDFGKAGFEWMTAEAAFIRETRKPLLGICFGHQLICHAFGTKIGIIDAKRKEHTLTTLRLKTAHPLLPQFTQGQAFQVEESHNQKAVFGSLPDVLENAAVPEPNWQNENKSLKESAIQLVRHKTRPIFGTQFHPETFDGAEPAAERIGNALLRQFESICERASRPQLS